MVLSRTEHFVWAISFASQSKLRNLATKTANENKKMQFNFVQLNPQNQFWKSL